MADCSFGRCFLRNSRTRQEQLRSAFTNALNKISDVNQSRIVAAACDELCLESVEDVQLIISELYHRVVRDGSDCFHGKYVCIFKALRDGYPEFFEAESFPTRWECCERLLAALLKQEAPHFLEDIDPGQRRRCIAVSIMRLFGHLFLQGLCNHEKMIRELLDTDATRGMRATCRKGISFHSMLLPYVCRLPHEMEFQTECACTFLEVIGPSLAAADPGGFKMWCVGQLTRLHNRMDPCIQTTTRGHILVHNFLELGWVAERRVDPCDGKPYTLRELLDFYAKRYSPEEIKDYFASVCRSLEEAARQPARPLARQWGLSQGRSQRRSNRRQRHQR